MPDHFAVQEIESSAIPHSSCDMSVRNSSTFVLDLAGDLRVISPVVLHELPVAFPHVVTSVCPHSQSENRIVPLKFVGIVAHFPSGMGWFSYKVNRSNDSLCGFNKQEQNRCAGDMGEHFDCLGVAGPGCSGG